MRTPWSSFVWMFGMNIMTSMAAMITLSARFGHDAWANTSSLPAASLFESGGVKAVPASTASAHYAPSTIHSANQSTGAETLDYNVVITTASSAPVPTSVPSSLTPSETSAGRISWLNDDDDDDDDDGSIAIHHTEDMAASLHSLISAYTLCSKTKADACFNNNVGNASSSTHASNINTNAHQNINMAAMHFPHSSLLFLNTTSPSYVLINHTNATVVVWNAPAETPSAGNSNHLRHIADKLATALPFIEVCGLLAFVWEVVKIVHARVQARRKRRFLLSTSTESN